MISSPTRHLFKFLEMVHFLTCGEDKLSSEKVSPHLSSRLPSYLPSFRSRQDEFDAVAGEGGADRFGEARVGDYAVY